MIDPKGVIRVIQDLKAADVFSIATPADWRPGDDAIVPTAGSCGMAKDRMEGKQEGVTCHDWFFCTKKIDKAAVIAAISKNAI
jgi:peroxiredoxin (alkyl hydroperoxide reductase subunit C)